MIFTPDLDTPEGPLLLPDGTWALVERPTEGGRITHIDAHGRVMGVIARTERPNGLAIDRWGALWVAESMGPPSLIRTPMDGATRIVATGCQGEPFLLPNDLCFGPDGALCVTDSGVLRREWGQLSAAQRWTVTFDGRLYRYDPDRGVVHKLASGLPFPNGIAFGPDDHLYVGMTLDGWVVRYPWADGEIAGVPERFAFVRDPTRSGRGGPDGMAFGVNGCLYVAVPAEGHVAVVDPAGSVVERIRTHGASPTNVAFGLQGRKRVYVTEQWVGQFEVYDVGVDGLSLYG